VERLRQFERIAGGATAEIFRGAREGEHGTSRAVAIKRLRPEQADEPAILDSFVREAGIAVQLDHPHVLHALELGRDEAGYFLVYEWLDGQSLARWVSELGPMPPGSAVHLGLTMARVLAYLHALRNSDGQPTPLVHGDMCPANVLVGSLGQIKLTDFGLSCFLDGQSTPMRAGTEGFVAPEQKAGRGDTRSDLYGLGATLRAVSQALPQPVDAVVEHLLCTEPSARLSSATELESDLTAAASAVGIADGEKDWQAYLYSAAASRKKTRQPSLDHAVDKILSWQAPSSAGPVKPSVRHEPKAWLTRARAVALVLLLAAAATASMLRWATKRSTPADPVQSVEPSSQAEPLSTPPPNPAPSTAVALVPATPPGILRLNAIPWADATIDGQDYGSSPLIGLRLAAGRHAVHLSYAPKNLTRDVWIKIEPAQELSVVVDLRTGNVQSWTKPVAR